MVNDYNRFGYYQVGNYITHSKLDAYERSLLFNQQVQYNFNDVVFEKYDWTTEPAYTLAEVYYRRAKQLREKYDYIVLLFSGGADSTNALHAFVNNGLEIDEIVTMTTLDGDHNPYSFYNIEVTKVCLPIIKNLKERFPNLKHTNFDATSTIIDYYLRYKDNIPYYQNNVFIPTVSAYNSIKDCNPAWEKMAEAGKSVCFLFGHQKPIIHLQDGKYYWHFSDMMDAVVTAKMRMDAIDWTHYELFYSSPDAAEVLIKQGQVLKNCLKNPLYHHFLIDEFTQYGSALVNGVEKFLPMTALNELVYPFAYWDPSTFSKGKSISSILSQSSYWFYFSNEESAKYYTNAIRFLEDKYSRDWSDNKILLPKLNDTGKMLTGGKIKRIWSRSYALEK